VNFVCADLTEGICLLPEHWEEMQGDVESRAPEEACGLVAGQGRQALSVFPITNELHSPVRFRMAPEEQIHVFNMVEEQGWDILAIYHAHPEGQINPSPTDVAEFAYPGIVYLIWARQDGGWECRGFLIQEDEIVQVPVSIAGQK